jgi:hypothetical protein
MHVKDDTVQWPGKSDFSVFFFANLFFLCSYHNKEGEETTLFVNHVRIHIQF